MHLYLSVVDCLENICNDGARLWSQDSLTDVRGLLIAITTTDFVTALVITNSCLKYLSALTACLQAEAKDIVAAVSEIVNVTAAVQDIMSVQCTPTSCKDPLHTSSHHMHCRDPSVVSRGARLPLDLL